MPMSMPAEGDAVAVVLLHPGRDGAWNRAVT